MSPTAVTEGKILTQARQPSQVHRNNLLQTTSPLKHFQERKNNFKLIQESVFAFVKENKVNLAQECKDNYFLHF